MTVEVHVQANGFIVDELRIQRKQIPERQEVFRLGVWGEVRVARVIPANIDHGVVVIVVPENFR
jgi:hypothetical protein